MKTEFCLLGRIILITERFFVHAIIMHSAVKNTWLHLPNTIHYNTFLMTSHLMMISATDEGTDDARARDVGKRKVF